MIKRFSSIFKTELFSASFYTALSTIIKILTSFVSSKIIAIDIGPVGLGKLGQLSSFSNVIQTFSNGGITTGLTKYISEYRQDEEEVDKIVISGFTITFLCSSIAAMVMFFFANYITYTLFSTYEYVLVIRIFALSIYFFSINRFLLSVINGHKRYKLFNKVNLVSSIFGLAFTVLLVINYNVIGALIASVTYQSIVVIIALILIKGKGIFWLSKIRLKVDRVIGKKLMFYSFNTIISSVSIPVVQIMIRNHIDNVIGADSIGYYEAVTRISNLFLMFVTTSLMTYFLPSLSELKDELKIRSEIFKTLKLVLPFVLFGCILIYFLRIFIIKILFADTFLQMEVLFAPQLIGDLFKIIAWIFAFQFVARGRIKLNIILNVVFALSLFVFSYVFINRDGIIGVSYAYLLNYLIYLLVILYIVRKQIFGIKR